MVGAWRFMSVALVAVGCAWPMTPAEHEIAGLAVAAETQPCVAKLRISHRAKVRPGTFAEVLRDGSVVRSHKTEYELEACGVAVRLGTACTEHHGRMFCEVAIGDAKTLAYDETPHRTRLVAELLAVFEHAQRLLDCPLLAGPFELERSADATRAAYVLDACGARRVFRVACARPADPAGCRVDDQSPSAANTAAAGQAIASP